MAQLWIVGALSFHSLDRLSGCLWAMVMRQPESGSPISGCLWQWSIGGSPTFGQTIGRCLYAASPALLIVCIKRDLATSRHGSISAPFDSQPSRTILVFRLPKRGRQDLGSLNGKPRGVQGLAPARGRRRNACAGKKSAISKAA